MRPGLDESDRRRALDSARLAYDDAAKRGYVSAWNDLAVLPRPVEANYEQGVELYKRAAQQGHPLAMYNLGLRYRDGSWRAARSSRKLPSGSPARPPAALCPP